METYTLTLSLSLPLWIRRNLGYPLLWRFFIFFLIKLLSKSLVVLLRIYMDRTHPGDSSDTIVLPKQCFFFCLKSFLKDLRRSPYQVIRGFFMHRGLKKLLNIHPKVSKFQNCYCKHSFSHLKKTERRETFQTKKCT